MITTIIHHSADYDGIFCREIAKKFLPDANLIGWDFADKPLPIPEGSVYVLDLPPDKPFGLETLPAELAARMVWIDHHKSAIDKFDIPIPKSDLEAYCIEGPMSEVASRPPTNRQFFTGKLIDGYRIDGVAACRLAWQWFTGFTNRFGDDTPQKQDYVERRVTEPLAVRLAGEYDVWDHRGDGDLEFQFGLRLVDASSDFWEALLQTDAVGDKAVLDTVRHGEILMKYQNRIDAGICRDKSFIVEFEGLKFLALNNARFNSNTFAALDVTATGHDALLGFSYNGKDWSVSLYHAAHRKELDLSQIAVKYGGGGHRGACGFRTPKLPF